MTDMDLQNYLDLADIDKRFKCMVDNVEKLYSDADTVELRNIRYNDEIDKCGENIFQKIWRWWKGIKYVPSEFENKLGRLFEFLKDDDMHHINYVDGKYINILTVRKYEEYLTITHFCELNEKLKAYSLNHPFILHDRKKIKLIEMFDYWKKKKRIDHTYRWETDNEDLWKRLRFFPAAESEADIEKACCAIDLYMVEMI